MAIIAPRTHCVECGKPYKVPSRELWCDQTCRERWHKKRKASLSSTLTASIDDKLLINVFRRMLRVGKTGSYKAAHVRVRRAKGRVEDHKCAQCGNQARDWAYDGHDPDEMIEILKDDRYVRSNPDGYPALFSKDVNRYMPLCRSCHSRYDRNMRKSRTRDYRSVII